MARLAIIATGEAKAREGDDLAKMRDALAATKEDRQGLEDEVARLTVERMLLLLELETSRDEMSTLHSQAGKDKEAMVENYQKALEQIFTYGYERCVFKDSIRGDRPRISDGILDFADPLPLEFFVNIWCSPTPTAMKPRQQRYIRLKWLRTR